MSKGDTMSVTPIDFFAWYESQGADWQQRPWLVLGKGPSFSLVADVDKSQYNTFGLNHVVLQTKIDVAHMIDLDVVEHCGDIIASNAGCLVMPWVPHINYKPGKKTLTELAQQIPVLSRLAAEGRLLWYNKVGGRAKVAVNGVSPAVRVVNFSAEAPYALLGMAGAQTIRSLGIDGGASYASNFSGMPTLLANGQASFDKQFGEIARSIMTYKLDAAPLNVASPVRVFVATTEEQMLSVKVLEYSITKHASMTTEVVPMHASGIPIPLPRASANLPRTPFSFQRFLVPQLAGHHGRAIYLDSDMQVFADIRELWCQDMGGQQLLSVAPAPGADRKPQYSVMLLDCGALDWNIAQIVEALDSSRITYEDLMYRMTVAERQEARIPAEWNSLEQYVEGKTRLLHYTDMDTQPWIYAKHPFGYIWVRDLLEAIDNGFISTEYVLSHVQRGWVRPSLGFQVEHRIEDPFLLPRHALDLDKNYSPPYHKLHVHTVGAWISSWLYLNASVRRACHKFPLVAFTLRVALASVRRIKRVLLSL
jgi:hypothetical protein